ncbi:hypothetical protein SH601_14275 [Gracilibacillus sp. S3-1-1]|uniref:Uncharacterized protein n=1 Tax=Gracilibacillus pellucidus TaxID=3095368 RepID=A0ACC6M833_9BACI|nr:hypothetical protein [Gracilibacillus sp. S3-1-1]MDX8047155.1 hypothetical protein [Gracilibacillus sp. S3-1-1]
MEYIDQEEMKDVKKMHVIQLNLFVLFSVTIFLLGIYSGDVLFRYSVIMLLLIFLIVPELYTALTGDTIGTRFVRYKNELDREMYGERLWRRKAWNRVIANSILWISIIALINLGGYVKPSVLILSILSTWIVFCIKEFMDMKKY